MFGLQNTLVHYEVNPKSKKEFEYFVIYSEGKDVMSLGVNLRPSLKESLVDISKQYSIVIISTCNKLLTDKIINLFDPHSKLVSLRLYDDSCIKSLLNKEIVRVKDLRILPVPLSKMVIIDNSVLSFAFNIKNGIPIVPYLGNKADNELKILMQYLNHLSQYDDIQEENKKVFNLENLIESEYFDSSGLDDLNLDESSRFDSDKEKGKIKTLTPKKTEKIEPIKRNHLVIKNNFHSNSSYESNSLLSCLILLNKGPLNYDSIYNTNLVSFEGSGDSEQERKKEK